MIENLDERRFKWTGWWIALLESAQKAIAEAWFARKEKAEGSTHIEPVDKSKNLAVIKKFIEMSADNIALQKNVKDLISENL